MRPSLAYDPERHAPGTPAAQGRCSWHADADVASDGCTGEAVVSFEDEAGEWQSGCQRALEELVEREEIEPLGQGA